MAFSPFKVALPQSTAHTVKELSQCQSLCVFYMSYTMVLCLIVMNDSGQHGTQRLKEISSQ